MNRLPNTSTQRWTRPSIGVRDPLTFIAAAATMALVTLAGAAIPARRAASIDPIRALRED